MSYICDISTFPFVGAVSYICVVFRLFRSQTGEVYCDISTFPMSKATNSARKSGKLDFSVRKRAMRARHT